MLPLLLAQTQVDSVPYGMTQRRKYRSSFVTPQGFPEHDNRENPFGTAVHCILA